MLKKIKAYGNTAVIILNKEDMECHDLKIGDVIDVQIISKVLLDRKAEARRRMGGTTEAGGS